MLNSVDTIWCVQYTLNELLALDLFFIQWHASALKPAAIESEYCTDTLMFATFLCYGGRKLKVYKMFAAFGEWTFSSKND